MTPEEFIRLGKRMHGIKHWRRDLSLRLGMSVSTISRALRRADQMPLWMEVGVRALYEKHLVTRLAQRAAKEQEARDRHRYKGKATHRKPKPRYRGKFHVHPEDPRDDDPPRQSADPPRADNPADGD